MSKKQLVIKHDLSKLSPEELNQYLRDVSEFIGLDPDLNALDTIWMQNEGGPGQSLVVYARRGTAEILRNKLEIEVSSLVQNITPQGSIIFTATGKAFARQEIAIGSKYIAGLQGKALDDAIMTASTRALRRLTMQFTSLGILDESEVGAIKGSTENPAAGAQLSGSAMVMPPMPTPNNAPGKDVTTVVPALPAAPVVLVDQKTNLEEVYKEGAAGLAALPVPPFVPGVEVDPASVAPAAVAATVPAERPKRARKKPNTVSMEGPEAEIVSSPAPAPEPPPQPAVVPAIVVPVVPAAAPVSTVVPPAPAPAVAPSSDFEGKPTAEQMDAYRKRVGVYTAELPSSENMGSVQKMRAFITRLSGAAPQFMTTEQWEETLAWFESFVAKNQVKGLVKYINDTLGVK